MARGWARDGFAVSQAVVGRCTSPGNVLGFAYPRLPFCVSTLAALGACVSPGLCFFCLRLFPLDALASLLFLTMNHLAGSRLFSFRRTTGVVTAVTSPS